VYKVKIKNITIYIMKLNKQFHETHDP